ncbi:hypothetical protein EVAR_54852_1 [Eumeta japonica]|uniref:Uncharacterized protein n=1 Tax=Eumeta variegata TaxID=151549 RepID=A0A4C1YFI5_EUMVA|nr:hypothetical protein EVAR_54852_1 [Eumeta japonica]
MDAAQAEKPSGGLVAIPGVVLDPSHTFDFRFSFAFDLHPGVDFDTTPGPAFNSDSATDHSSDFNEAKDNRETEHFGCIDTKDDGIFSVVPRGALTKREEEAKGDFFSGIRADLSLSGVKSDKQRMFSILSKVLIYRIYEVEGSAQPRKLHALTGLNCRFSAARQALESTCEKIFNTQPHAACAHLHAHTPEAAEELLPGASRPANRRMLAILSN